MSATALLRHVRLVRPRLSLRGLLDRVFRYDAEWRARANLARLDDHLLRDIGLSRSDIAEELRRPFGCR